MKFFVDESLPLSLTQTLRQFGQAQHVRDVGLVGAPDFDVATFAFKGGLIFVTRAIEFGNQLVFPRGSHRGLIIIRAPSYFDQRQLSKLAHGALLQISANEIPSSIIVVEPGKIRVRKLS